MQTSLENLFVDIIWDLKGQNVEQTTRMQINFIS